MITSIKIGGLEVGVSPDYAVAQESIVAFKSAIQREPVAVERPGTYPALVRSQVQPRTLPITVIILGASLDARRIKYGTLVTACGTGYPPVAVSYDEAGTRYTWMAHLSGPIPEEWYGRATIEGVAFDPEPVESVAP